MLPNDRRLSAAQTALARVVALLRRARTVEDLRRAKESLIQLQRELSAIEPSYGARVDIVAAIDAMDSVHRDGAVPALAREWAQRLIAFGRFLQDSESVSPGHLGNIGDDAWRIADGFTRILPALEYDLPSERLSGLRNSVQLLIANLEQPRYPAGLRARLVPLLRNVLRAMEQIDVAAGASHLAVLKLRPLIAELRAISTDLLNTARRRGGLTL